MRYVYVIKSLNSEYKYIGLTDNLKKRINEHNDGVCKATKPYKPFELITYIALKNKDRAVELEKYLKTGSGKAFLANRLL